jgi:hypothetical protein
LEANDGVDEAHRFAGRQWRSRLVLEIFFRITFSLRVTHRAPPLRGFPLHYPDHGASDSYVTASRAADGLVARIRRVAEGYAPRRSIARVSSANGLSPNHLGNARTISGSPSRRRAPSRSAARIARPAKTLCGVLRSVGNYEGGHGPGIGSGESTLIQRPPLDDAVPFEQPESLGQERR